MSDAITIKSAGFAFATIVAVGLYTFRRRASSKCINFQKTTLSTKGINLRKRTVIITGATDGIGYQLAVDLVRRGCGNIIIGCRNIKRGKKAVDGILAEAAAAVARDNNDKNIVNVTELKCLELDLSSLDSVKVFAQKVKCLHPKGFYALVCNAGVWIPMNQNRKTIDGFEIHFGVNHLAHFLLVRLLTDNNYLASSTNDNEARVVIVSSSLMKSGKIDFTTKSFIHEGRMTEKSNHVPSGYADSKLMNHLLCKQLSHNMKLQGSNLTAYSVSPGWCRTNLAREVPMPWYVRIIFAPICLLFQRSSFQGAQNLVFCLVEKKENLVSGEFYREGIISDDESHYANSLGKDASKTLWDLSEGLISTHL